VQERLQKLGANAEDDATKEEDDFEKKAARGFYGPVECYLASWSADSQMHEA